MKHINIRMVDIAKTPLKLFHIQINNTNKVFEESFEHQENFNKVGKYNASIFSHMHSEDFPCIQIIII